MTAPIPASAEGRVACVDLPALPLQLLLRDHPSWRKLPTAVVADDRPTSELLWVNAEARKLRVLPGMRFAAARALAPQLRADVVTEAHVEHTVGELFTALHTFSPRVEPSDTTPGVFFLDPGGLARLYGSVEQWSMAVHQELRTRGFSGAVIVGFQRFRCYAVARASTSAEPSLPVRPASQTGPRLRGDRPPRRAPSGRPRRDGPGFGSCWVIPDPAQEARMAATVPLTLLDLPPRLRESLDVLGVRTLGELVALPRADLQSRFGEQAAKIHALASEGRWDPLRPRVLRDPITTHLAFEHPENDHGRLCFRLKPALESLMAQLATRGEGMSALHLTFELDHAGEHHEHLEPATPTLDVRQVLELVRLRLDSRRLPAAIEGLGVELEGTRVHGEQIALFRTRCRRDLDAGARALARLKAAFGPDAVTRARTVPAHLPEASFVWEPVTHVQFPEPSDTHPDATLVDTPRAPLAHRLLERPMPLPTPNRHEPARWPNLDPAHGPVVRMHGPWRISGGWWVRTVERDYYYAETRRGDLLWIFYDRPRRRWFLHGEVD